MAALLASVAPAIVPAQNVPVPSVDALLALPPLDRPTLNFYGVTGAIDTPTADTHPDGDLTFTSATFGNVTRNTLSFQLAPRLQGSFRYSRFGGLDFGGFEVYYDRSFDLSLQVLKEGRYVPAIKVGLQDFVGTGLFSGEYVVATKQFGPVKVSAGLGWGRLAGDNQIGSPFGDRQNSDVGVGGDFNAGEWFRGPAAPFGSVLWQATPKLTLMAEYSSDIYRVETGSRNSSRILDRESDFNFGANYQVNESVGIGAYYLYGAELGVNLNLAINPYRPPIVGSVAPAPGPVAPRPDRRSAPQAFADTWAANPDAERLLIGELSRQLSPQGLTVESLATDGSTVTVRFRNARYGASAQAVGRVARALTRVLPASVETFRIVPSSNGLPAAAVILRRSDIEALVNQPDGAAQLLAVAGLVDAVPSPGDLVLNDAFFPRFRWSVGPYVRNSYFDPDAPIRIGGGLRATAEYEPVPGLLFAGSVAQQLIGNLDDSNRLNSSSKLPNVRTSIPIYDREGDTALESLTASYAWRPASGYYARATGGYLERMFAGVSAEVLWKPVNARLGLGAEVNYVAQRAPDLGFGLADGGNGVDAYDVVTGHVSAYYSLDNGYEAQVDVGRYLAGDVGATLSLARTFDNGIRVGAFATMTDVSAEEFGEGSFDKGINFSIPLEWFTGQPSRRNVGTTLRPVTRDGGARLSVPGRLYNRVDSWHRDELEDQWGRVWR